MQTLNSRQQLLRTTLFGLASLAVMGLAGCQSDIGGQTLPSPYYLSDDVQYFPAGPQFKLAREAAALKAAAAQEEQTQHARPR